MDLKTILSRMNKNQEQQQTPIVTENWALPVAETVTPKITGDKYRRYIEYFDDITAPHAATTTVIQQFYDYPSKILNLQLKVFADTGDATADEIIILADDVQTCDISPTTLKDLDTRIQSTVNAGSPFHFDSVSGDYSGFLLTDNINKPPYSYQDIDDNGDIIVFNFVLNTFVAKKFEVQIKNTQAAVDDAITALLVTERPIESKYSVSSNQRFD